MSSILIIIDGLGDRPCKLLDGKTPLEAAQTPTMDSLAQQGLCGLTTPLVSGFPVSTHNGTAPLFGLSIEPSRKLARGPIEAAGIGMKITPRDVLLRGNFATLSDKHILVDRRAGRIDEDQTRELTDALNEIPPHNGIEITIKPTTGHRAVVRVRGANISSKISSSDPGRIELKTPPEIHPLNEYSEAKRTAVALNEWCLQVRQILAVHPINKKRVEDGLLPANGVIMRGAGEYQQYKNILREVGVAPLVIAGEATIIGLANLFGFETISKQSFTGMVDTDIRGKIEAAKEALKTSPLVILHFKATDICAHDLDPIAKMRYIERVDKALVDLVDDVDNIVISSDHSTSSETGHHTGDPVPSILTYPGSRRDSVKEFSESSCMQGGGLNGLNSTQLLLMLLDGMGVLRNYQHGYSWLI